VIILLKSGGPKVNYQSIGSGGGRKAVYADETVTFAATDEPIKASDISKGFSWCSSDSYC
jgi:phosphate transport system substrate-binding protein